MRFTDGRFWDIAVKIRKALQLGASAALRSAFAAPQAYGFPGPTQKPRLVLFRSFASRQASATLRPWSCFAAPAAACYVCLRHRVSPVVCRGLREPFGLAQVLSKPAASTSRAKPAPCLASQASGAACGVSLRGPRNPSVSSAASPTLRETRAFYLIINVCY